MTTPSIAASGAAAGSLARSKTLLAKGDVYFILAAFVLVASLLSPSFLTEANVSNLLTQSALLGILSVGQFMVVAAGGFDLREEGGGALFGEVGAVDGGGEEGGEGGHGRR